MLDQLRADIVMPEEKVTRKACDKLDILSVTFFLAYPIKDAYGYIADGFIERKRQC